MKWNSWAIQAERWKQRMANMRKQRLHAIILFVLFMMLCACAAAEGRVVRVAFLEQEGMSFIGHTGKISGYNFDYLEKISEYTGWQWWLARSNGGKWKLMTWGY